MSIVSICKTNGIALNDRRKVSMGGSSKRSKSQIKYICRHHSGVNVDQSMKILEDYWKSAHGWKTGGYNIVIHFNGDVDFNYDYDTISNGVGNHNTPTFQISVLGNGKFTDAQEKSFYFITKEVQRELGISNANVKGHNEFRGHQTNSCPGINMNTVRNCLKHNKIVGGANVTPDTSYKPTSKTIKVGTQATHWETGSAIPKFVIGGVYDVLEEKATNKSHSKKKLLIGKGTVPTGWLLEQDVEGFKKPTVTVTANNNKPDEIVKDIQRNVGSTVDGWNGPKTRIQVVRLYQRFVGAKDDGVVGNETVSKGRTLYVGYFGWDVYAVQSMLYLKGYKIVGKPDQDLGDNTIKAVKQFQKDKGITVDGIVGKNTIRLLFI